MLPIIFKYFKHLKNVTKFILEMNLGHHFWEGVGVQSKPSGVSVASEQDAQSVPSELRQGSEAQSPEIFLKFCYEMVI